MTGAFCTACGARAKTDEAPGAAQPAAYGAPAAGPAAGPAASAPRKTSPIVWILGGSVALLLLIGLAVAGAGFFFIHKAKQAGIDPELMRTNPGLAAARIIAATNPDLEVVADDGHGRIKIRQKSSGKTTTVNFEDLKNGRIRFQEDGKDAITVETRGDGSDASVQMKSGSESVTIGANQATMPSWIPAYPNAKAQGNYSASGKDGTAASFQFQTPDAVKDVIAFYENGLKQNGFKISLTSTSDSGGVVSAEDQGNKRTALVTVGVDGKGTTVAVTYSQK